MNNKKLSALLLAIASTSTWAGTMGDVVAPEKLLMFEGGLSYSYAFYQGHATFAESYTLVTPNGVSINPKRFYPNNFFGGYVGLSLYIPQQWLFNTRYDAYGSKSKFNASQGTVIKLAPAKLSFTADKVFGNINSFSAGVGGGAIIETVNNGHFLTNAGVNTPASESIQGRARIDPLVEAFVMYRMNNFGVKFNAGYQIPVNNIFGNGDLNLNLGINYSVPV